MWEAVDYSSELPERRLNGVSLGVYQSKQGGAPRVHLALGQGLQQELGWRADQRVALFLGRDSHAGLLRVARADAGYTLHRAHNKSRSITVQVSAERLGIRRAPRLSARIVQHRVEEGALIVTLPPALGGLQPNYAAERLEARAS
ncbi:hypothetical protein [Algihabitans albus]|uniref:hypothetical protein n=1 Tax=Algihabitans albus TaxID=2164067 RepID=UPI000E5C9DF4|nr:hypothetical protein [Algihabitans albus]